MSKTSFDFIWELLAPASKFQDRKDVCRAYWNALSLPKQRQIYKCIRDRLKRFEKVPENPYFAIRDCDPQPKDYNGTPEIDNVRDHSRIACYNGHWGIYTFEDIRLFNLLTKD